MALLFNFKPLIFKLLISPGYWDSKPIVTLSPTTDIRLTFNCPKEEVIELVLRTILPKISLELVSFVIVGEVPNNGAAIFPLIVLGNVQVISGLLPKLILFPTEQVKASPFHFKLSIETIFDIVVPP